MDNDLAKVEEKKLLLEQYKSYLTDLQQIGSRNEANRSFMLSLLSLLFVFLSLAGKEGTFFDISPQVTVVVLGVAILICLAWFLRIRTYNAIISSKFKVLQTMEDELPFKCFQMEYGHLMKQKPVYLIKIEGWIPIILAFAFLLVTILQ